MVESCRKATRGATALFTAFATIACASAPPREGEWRRRETRWIAMGVEARLVVFVRDNDDANRATAAARASIEEDEARFSDYRTAGELARVEAAAGTGPIAVSAEFCGVALRARELSAASDGAFDVTIGPLTRLWRSPRADGVKPSDADLDAARARIGWRGFEVHGPACQVELRRPGMRLDFGGIAKGAACDRAVRRLRTLGFPRCLVSLAGDVAAGDPPPGFTGWRLGLAPRGGAPEGWILLANACASTSGDAEQFFAVDGARLSHIVNPLTGRGVEGGPPVTVVATDGAVADGLATALVLVPESERARLVGAFPGAAARVGVARETATYGPFPRVSPPEGEK
jgi:thiamine biosynthesis lipoprotein